MKSHLIILAVLFLSGSLFAQSMTPAPSPFAKVVQVVGVTEVSIEYSRPGIKGRQIFGGLVPFDEVWRTGANSVTKLTLNTDATIEGKKVPMGEYSIYTIPGEREWKVMINKIAEGGPDYKASEDIASFKIKPQSRPLTVERFTIEFADLTENSAVIELKWARTVVPIKFEVNTDANVEKNIEAFEDSDENEKNAGGWYQIANYYYGKKQIDDAQEALETSLEIDDTPYFALRLMSRILAEKGEFADAITYAKKSLVSAQKAGNDNYVKMNEDAIAEWSKKVE